MNGTETKIHIIGVGSDGLAGMTSRARELVQRADLLLGADSVLDLIPASSAQRFRLGPDLHEAVRTLEQNLGKKRMVVLAGGDPLFYGSSINLFSRLAGRYRVEIVPGVSSLTACAAAAAVPLVSRDDTLTVLPATLDEAQMLARLREAETAMIVKIGRHLAKVRRVLSRLDRLDDGVYVEHATLPAQRVIPLASVNSEIAPYFSIALVCRRGL